MFKLNTKKAYMVEVPQELEGTDKFFSAFIEFEEVEIFKRMISIPKTADQQY